jgi:hypothetical protein
LDLVGELSEALYRVLRSLRGYADALVADPAVMRVEILRLNVRRTTESDIYSP